MKAEGTPSDDPRLVFLTRLVQLACSARTQLRDQRFQFPAASTEMMSVVYPCLMGCLFDADDREDPSAVQPGALLAVIERRSNWRIQPKFSVFAAVIVSFGSAASYGSA